MAGTAADLPRPARRLHAHRAGAARCGRRPAPQTARPAGIGPPRAAADKGRLDDPETEAAADDARELAYRIARGEGRLFQVGLYLTVYATTEDDLAGEITDVRAAAESLLVTTQPASFRTLQGWATCLPLGVDCLKLRPSSTGSSASRALRPRRQT